MKTVALNLSPSFTLNVRIWGEENLHMPTLVMVHGFPDNSLIWQRIAERLAPYLELLPMTYAVLVTPVFLKPHKNIKSSIWLKT
jgi:pimeloyl-ACP methyl ester carboxylesterase